MNLQQNEGNEQKNHGIGKHDAVVILRMFLIFSCPAVPTTSTTPVATPTGTARDPKENAQQSNH